MMFEKVERPLVMRKQVNWRTRYTQTTGSLRAYSMRDKRRGSCRDLSAAFVAPDSNAPD